MPKVPDSVIAEIRDRIDLVELIGGYVNLKRAGKGFVGLCPFHQEKTPSFHVSPDRNIYHCFGCKVTGDAFRFLMEHDHSSFPEALRTLAARAGVEIAQWERRGDESGEDFDALYRAHAIAVRLYRELLAEKEGAAAREEIARRGLSAETVAEYRLGASADAWDRLLKVAGREGIRASQLERAGLVVRREPGPGHYDRFRDRLMFPIETVGSKVVGFGGRVLGAGEPKYLNSPEGPLFRKRKTLYGFPQAQAAIRESGRAILVEGYTDVLALANVGIRGAVAALGTAFTEEHAAFLARSCREVIVAFDGDAAGRKAAAASCGPLLGAGLEIRMAAMPEGEDPDSLVRREGKDALLGRLTRASGVLDALLGDEGYSPGAAQERAVRRVLEALATIADPLRRRVHVDDLAERTGLPAALLEEQLASLRKKEAETSRRVAEREAASAGAAGAERVPTPGRVVPAAAGKLPPLERDFIAVLLHSENLGSEMLGDFGPDHFEHETTRRVVAAAVRIRSSGGSPSAGALLAEFAEDEATRSFLGRLSVTEHYQGELERRAADCRKQLQRRPLEREMKTVMAEMRKAKARGETDRVRELGQRKLALRRELESLGSPREVQ
jgi:DNA primase